MRNDTESPFSLTLTQSDLQLQVLRFNGREALNQPYRFDLELIGLAPPIPPTCSWGIRPSCAWTANRASMGLSTASA